MEPAILLSLIFSFTALLLSVATFSDYIIRKIRSIGSRRRIREKMINIELQRQRINSKALDLQIKSIEKLMENATNWSSIEVDVPVFLSVSVRNYFQLKMYKVTCPEIYEYPDMYGTLKMRIEKKTSE